jgi:hypothetical protein
MLKMRKSSKNIPKNLKNLKDFRKAVSKSIIGIGEHFLRNSKGSGSITMNRPNHTESKRASRNG